MKRWKIRTGDYKSNTAHKANMNAMTAAVLAFEKRPPKEAGMLTECVHPEGVAFYVSTEQVLKLAGYSIRKNHNDGGETRAHD